MAHLRKDPITGHLFKSPGDAADHLAKEGEAKCQFCEGCSNDHEQYTVTFSGITICDCVACEIVHGPDTRGLLFSSIFSPNRIWTVTRVDAPVYCIWEYNAVGDFGNAEKYAEDDCTGDVVWPEETLGVVKVSLKREAAGWFLHGFYTSLPGRYYAEWFFGRVALDAGDCGEGVVFNDWTECGDPILSCNSGVMGWGGTGTVVPI